MEIKTIKGISNERWIEFKTLAAKKNVPLGAFFEIILSNYSRNSDLFWNKVLSRKKILSDSEADAFEEDIKKLRKDKGFRV